MPELATLLLFTASALALVAIPGPSHVYIVARSIDQGRAAGFASAFGVAHLLHLAVKTPTAPDEPAGDAPPPVAAKGLGSDLLYALGAGRAGVRLRGNAHFARRRRRVAGAVYLALAVVALLGGRRRAA